MRLVDIDHFRLDPVTVAPTLLGLVVTHGGVSLRITEVEAYYGAQDPGSHAFRRRTERNDALFGPPGTVYAYINYGIHRALNLVCGSEGVAAGCLVRSGEITDGRAIAVERRAPVREGSAPPAPHKLASGPGNLAKALGIDLHLNGVRVYEPDSPITVHVPDNHEDLTDNGSVSVGPRVGVSGPGGDGANFPWRFWITGDRTVSPYRASTTRVRPRT